MTQSMTETMAPTRLSPEDLFVFVGAGASVSPPAGLANFEELRDEILRQLGLSAFVRGASDEDPAKVEVVCALVPEPFMLDLKDAEIPVEPWLEEVLGAGSPNAVHKALAALILAGAKVWTVNFESLIERADPGVKATAWPNAPASDASLIKAHGTLGGRLIFAADQVLAPLSDVWRQRLRADVDGRTVVFLGYRGRDLDFQPVWSDVLAGAHRVIWFEQRDPSDPMRAAEQTWKEMLLREVNARGALVFPPAAPPPPTTEPAPGSYPNASWDFVCWCREQNLVDVNPEFALRLLEKRAAPDFPLLPGDRTWAKPMVLGHLGDYIGARDRYLSLLVRAGTRRRAAGSLVRLQVTHGGRVTGALLRCAEFAPPFGRWRTWRTTAKRKRLTIYHRAAVHRAVLRGTRHIGEGDISTLLILRAASLRVTGSLDEAAATAEKAFRRARREEHAVRAAHAAFQKANALLWAERIDEASHCLRYELQPFAVNASNRWVAWAEFIAACIAVREADATGALSLFALSDTRFGAEALIDGRIGVGVARLTAHRLVGDEEGFIAELRSLSDLIRGRQRGQRYYARRNRFTAEAIRIERAEFARVREELREAHRLYREIAKSSYPLHAALGELGLAMIEARDRRAEHAREIADSIGARLVSRRATELLRHRSSASAREVFFC